MVATNNTGSSFTLGVTNTLNIAEGETGELVMVYPSDSAVGTGAFITKDGVTIPGLAAMNPYFSTVQPKGATVAGPATFSLAMTYSSSVTTPDPSKGAMMTVRITPMTFNPNHTVTVAPGMGNVQVEMESSTNLVTWTTATNGTYNDALKFFRVKLTKQ